MTFSADRESIIPAGDLAVMLQYARQSPPPDYLHHGLAAHACAFVEVGVYRGGSARELYKIAEAQGRPLFLFDTFAGHPAPSADDTVAHPEGRYADCVDPAELAAELSHAHIVVGPFPWSLKWPKPVTGLRYVAFAHIDVDLYESTRDAITALTPYMVPGGLMYFDDYGVGDCPGATKAVDELLPDRQLLPNGKAVAWF